MGSLKVSVVDDGARLIVSGDIDADSIGEFEAALNASADDVQVDLGACTFMDSTGIAALVVAKSGRSPGLRVVDASEQVALVLSVTGLTETLSGENGVAPSP